MARSKAERAVKIAEEAFELLGSEQQIAPFSALHSDFQLDEAYRAAALLRDMRQALGVNPIGRKIGFTNPTVRDIYGISGPIWNYMFDSTVYDLNSVAERFALSGFAEPRIEPEIALHLASAPNAEMDDQQLLGCIDWIAHGFEIVHSIFPGWQFTAADAIAAYGLHGSLLLGDKHWISNDLPYWEAALSDFVVELARDGHPIAQGHAQNVMGGPVKALRFLVDELERYPKSEPLRSGEIVTTGTLTDAMPAGVGQTWTTQLKGINVRGARVRFQ